MSLIRQIWLLLSTTLMVAFMGSFAVWMASSRDYLETQLRLKNADNAQSLALSLSQQRGDLALMDLAVSAQFDTGFYRSIRLLDAAGKVVSNHEAAVQLANQSAPAWFVRMVNIESPAGVAQVTDGWRALGSVEVVSHSGFAYDQLWESALKTGFLLALLGGVAGVVASIGVRGIRRPLDATVSQAEALMERRFITVEEPRVPELARLSQAMNTVVGRLKTLFDEQASQVEQLRQQACCDGLTGVSLRSHFVAQLQNLLGSDDGPAGGTIWLVRVVDLASINRSVGHKQTDQLLRRLAAAMQDVTQGVPGTLIGRLNGPDFAIAMGDSGVPLPQPEHMADALRRLFAEEGVHGRAVVGAANWHRGEAMGALLALADSALARAESRSDFAVESAHQQAGQAAMLGEDQWRRRLGDTIAQRRGQLVRFPVIDREGRLIHHECPMRLQLDPQGPFETAAQWLPMALRCGLVARLDLLAVDLALSAIREDGIQRGVNLSPASLLDSQFLPLLRTRLMEAGQAAQSLWLEVAESAAVDNFAMVRELCKQLKALGVRVGLEHAGDRLTRVEFLFEAGLDYVKLDGSVVQGVASDGARRAFVSGIVTMLHSLGLQVYGEGVSDPEDLTHLWSCGIDGATGPAVKAP